jgi:hypothetical protein
VAGRQGQECTTKYRNERGWRIVTAMSLAPRAELNEVT